MSQKRVITGTDDRGRPISRWEDTPAEDAPYGFMEPAFESTVERRQATPDELAAAVARETPAGYLATPKPPRNANAQTNAERMQASRMRGTQRHIEVVAAARATPTQHAWNGSGRHLPPVEEGTMDEPTPAPEDVIHTILTPSPLTALSDAAAIAHQKLEAVRVAQEAWEIAREALDHAMTECLTVIGTTPAPVTAPAPPPPSSAHGPAPRRTAREPRIEGLTERQSKAIELMLGGATRADIAREMSTTYQTIDGLLEAAARKKLLPVELIALLPARFAKYSGATA